MKPNFLNREIKIPQPIERAVCEVFSAPYKYVGGVLFGLVLGVVESPAVRSVVRRIRSDMETPDLGNFVDRFKMGYKSCHDAFSYDSKNA